MIDLTEVSEEELAEKTGLTMGEHQEIQAWMAREKAREDIRFLKINAVACFPDDDLESLIMRNWAILDKKVHNLDSLRLGATIGLQEGFRRGAKKACDAFEVLNDGEGIESI